MARPAIPAEIRRAVLVECGHRCAIPRCNQTELDVHHIVPWETCRTHEYSNLIALCPICHRRAHNGDIDRKSLMIYKENLAKEFGRHDNGSFQAEIVEIRRSLKEDNHSVPGYTFEFDFPDFPSAIERIVSRNIEAWGYEILASYQESQKADDLDKSVSDHPLSNLKNQLHGHYQIVRRDDQVISICYSIDYYNSGAAHGGRNTRVLNYSLRPFNPISIDFLLGDINRLPVLANYIRQKLADTGHYEDGWLAEGIQPDLNVFSLFNIGRYGLVFTFPEYSIACYAQGEQKVYVDFQEIAHCCDPKAIESIKFNEL